jgi:hypothetical protein
VSAVNHTYPLDPTGSMGLDEVSIRLDPQVPNHKRKHLTCSNRIKARAGLRAVPSSFAERTAFPGAALSGGHSKAGRMLVGDLKGAFEGDANGSQSAFVERAADEGDSVRDASGWGEFWKRM